MKNLKLIYIVLIITLLSGCATSGLVLSKTMDKVYIGMPISEFKEKVVSEELVEMNEKIVIYKKTFEGYMSETLYRFFYFENNILTKVDEGERAVDYRIKVDKKISNHKN